MQRIPISEGQLFVASKDDILHLFEHNNQQFNVIWNLASELEFLGVDELKIAHTVLLGKIDDMSIPSDPSRFVMQLSMVVSALRRGGQVICHCFAGHGRSGLAVAAIKYAIDGRVDWALETAKQYCNGPETKEQVEFVRNLKFIY